MEGGAVKENFERGGKNKWEGEEGQGSRGAWVLRK